MAYSPPGVADPPGDRGERLDVAVIEDAELECAGMAALGVSPPVVPRYANHDAAGKLIVATGLNASDPIIEIMSAERLAVKVAAGSARDPFLTLSPRPPTFPPT